MRTKYGFIVLLALALSAGMAAADPLAYTGVIKVDSVTARPGDDFSVPVRIANNNASISAFFIPLRVSYPNLVYDSISMIGTSLSNDFGAQAGYIPSEGAIRVIILPALLNPVPTTHIVNGVLFRVHFHLSPAASLGTTEIDSIFSDTIIAGVNIETRITVTDSSGALAGTFNPGFVPGAIHVTSPTGVEDGGNSLPFAFNLGQNYPNPFNPTTMIHYSLPTASHVKLEVFNVLGQRVAMLEDNNKAAGNHTTEFNASSYPSGIYFYRLTSDNGVATKKMVLLK